MQFGHVVARRLWGHWFTLKLFKKILVYYKRLHIWNCKIFWKVGQVLKGFQCHFIILATKIKYPLSLVDYRPISLIGLLYKIIARIIALRIKRVIGSVIDDVRSTFVKGWNILEEPLTVNEICSWAKADGREILLFKADFNKAFDSINWGYLDSIMAQMNFGYKM